MNQPNTLSRRGRRSRPVPSPVRWAVGLLLLPVLLRLASFIQIALDGNPYAPFAVSQMVGIALPVVLAHQVSRGHRWARMAVWIWTAAIVVVGLAVGPWELVPMLFSMLDVAPILAASVLLALPRSSQFFRRP